jgi:hypothetical protein
MSGSLRMMIYGDAWILELSVLSRRSRIDRGLVLLGPEKLAVVEAEAVTGQASPQN